MPELVFGMCVAKPFLTFHAANGGGKSAHLIAGRDGLARALAVWALVIGFVHESGTSSRGFYAAWLAFQA